MWLLDVSTIGISAHILARQERTQQAACQGNVLSSCKSVLYPVSLAGRGCVTIKFRSVGSSVLMLHWLCQCTASVYVSTGVMAASANKRISE